MAKSTKKSTSFLVKIVFALVIIYLLYVFIGLQVQINEKKDQINNLDIQISNKATENQQLSDILDAEVDSEYVEKVARDLGYVNSDEKIYQSITD